VLDRLESSVHDESTAAHDRPPAPSRRPWSPWSPPGCRSGTGGSCWRRWSCCSQLPGGRLALRRRRL